MAILVNSPDEVPAGNLYIYGAGQIGQSLRDHILSDTKKYHFKGFLSSFASNTEGDNCIYNIEEHREFLSPKDNIIVANQYSREIIHHLSNLKIESQIYDAILLVFPCFGAQLSGEKQLEFTSRTDAIAQKLTSERSRSIYQAMSSLRSRWNTETIPEAYASFYRHMDAFYGKDTKYVDDHYFEYDIFQHINCVIEGGANIGIVTEKILSRMDTTGTLYSFEPMQPKILQSNAARNEAALLTAAKRENRYKIYAEALWSKQTTLYMAGHGDDFASYQVRTEGQQKDAVPAISIDAFCERENVQKVDFIKLDVEGAEPDVLAGAKNCIRRHRPAMAISIYHGPTQFHTIPEYLMTELSDYSFEIGHHSNSPWLETVLYCIPNQGTA